jgi:hypothetical protein
MELPDYNDRQAATNISEEVQYRLDGIIVGGSVIVKILIPYYKNLGKLRLKYMYLQIADFVNGVIACSK